MEQENEPNRTDVLKPNYESKLGTLEHWNDAYKQEIEQFKNNDNELGDIWFGKALQKKLVNYITKNFPDKNTKIFDVGFGNGVFLYKLAKQDYVNLYGIDYSPDSVQLAKMIIESKQKKHEKEYKINLFCEDINSTNKIINETFDVIHDKGSFDAYLMNKSNTLENYHRYIKSYSRNGTTLIITSCNNTREELRKKFPPEKGFKYIDEIKNKTFVFGGQEGQQQATQIYQITV
jgi:SAM-dependent methyltransferase